MWHKEDLWKVFIVFGVECSCQAWSIFRSDNFLMMSHDDNTIVVEITFQVAAAWDDEL